MVRGLVAKGGHYAAIWSRFNNHFRIGQYRQLPQSRMGEAIEYLMALEIRPRALPTGKPKALPAPEPSYEEQVETARQRMQMVCAEFFEASHDMARVLRAPFWGRELPEPARELAHALNYGAQALSLSLQQSRQALEWYTKAHMEGLNCLRA